MDYVQMTLDDWLSLKKEIKEEFIKASTSFVRIGYLLRKAEDSEGYKNDGYDSLSEWAHDELGLTATYVSRFKAINAKYSEGGYSDHLLPEFIGYGSAKLGEMLALPDEDMQMLTPEMKRSDIRALKEFNRDEPEAPDTESWILEMMEIIPEGVKEDLAKEYLQGALDGRKCAEIINPSGNSMKRTRAAMVAMTDEGLFVKTFGPEGGRRKISWQDFAQMLRERFEKWKPAQGTTPAEPEETPEENTQPATENTQSATENAQSATENAQSEQENAHPEQDPDQEAQEAEEPAGEEEQPADGTEQGETAADVADSEDAPAEGTDQKANKEKPEHIGEATEMVSKKTAEIMLPPEEPETVAPAQKPAESATYQDVKAMMDGINTAFVRKDWDRMLSLLEGLEPAIRKLKREEWQES